MNVHKMWVIVRKEWAEVFRNRFVLFTVGFLPLILTALPLIILGVSGSAEGLTGLSGADMPANFESLCEGLEGSDCLQYFFVTQFMLLFMLMPLAIPVTIASYSIVGEKTTRTLEPVLATPITTLELLMGKSLAAALPAVAATWIGFLLFVAGSMFLSVGPSVVARFFDPLWIIAIFLVSPLLAIASVSVAVMVSSRAQDPRVAEQLSMLVIMPLLGLFFGQIMGLIFIDRRMILLLAGIVALIDVGLVAFATRLFERETILVRWK